MTPQKESYREIPVKGGYTALVDESKYEELSQFQWIAFKQTNGEITAVRKHKGENGRKCTVAMHRQVLGLQSGDPREVYRVRSADKLDNRISNLLLGPAGSDQKIKWAIESVTPGLCPVCEKEFKTYPSKIALGRGKFCSARCYRIARRTNPPTFVPYTAPCEECKLPFRKSAVRNVFCSDKCEKKAAAKRYTKATAIRESAQVTGEIGELRVVIDLLKRGYWVFKPVVFGCGFDYLATKGEETERVEVKVGRMHKKTGWVATNRPRGVKKPIVHSLLAIVIDDLIIYERVNGKRETFNDEIEEAKTAVI